MADISAEYLRVPCLPMGTVKTDQKGYGLNLVFVESQFAGFYASSQLFFRIEFLTARDQIISDKTNEMTCVDAQAN